MGTNTTNNTIDAQELAAIRAYTIGECLRLCPPHRVLFDSEGTMDFPFRKGVVSISGGGMLRINRSTGEQEKIHIETLPLDTLVALRDFLNSHSIILVEDRHVFSQ